MSLLSLRWLGDTSAVTLSAGVALFSSYSLPGLGSRCGKSAQPEKMAKRVVTNNRVFGEPTYSPMCDLLKWSGSVCGWWMCPCTVSSTHTLLGTHTPRSLLKSSHWMPGSLHRPLGCCWTKIVLLQRRVPPFCVESLCYPQKPELQSPLLIFSKIHASNSVLEFSVVHFPCQKGEVVTLFVRVRVARCLTCVSCSP